GGTVSHALIHTLGGLYDGAGEFLNAGLARELADALFRADASVCRRRIGRAWVLSCCPGVYRAVVENWVKAEPRISLHTGTRVCGVVGTSGEIGEVETSGPEGRFRLGARAVIDATGTAEVVRLLDPALVQDDPQRAAGGLIFTLCGVAPGTLAFPKGLGILRAFRAA